MWLSELHGRIGQILQEKGDMQVVRFRSLKIDGIVGSGVGNYVKFTTDDFSVVKDFKQYQIQDNAFINKEVGKHFIINIPFN